VEERSKGRDSAFSSPTINAMRHRPVCIVVGAKIGSGIHAKEENARKKLTSYGLRTGGRKEKELDVHFCRSREKVGGGGGRLCSTFLGGMTEEGDEDEPMGA